MARGNQSKLSAPSPSASERRPSILRSILNMIAEFRRVTWPTPSNTLRLTIFVLILSAVLGLFFGLVVDAIFSRVITFIGGS